MYSWKIHNFFGWTIVILYHGIFRVVNHFIYLHVTYVFLFIYIFYNPPILMCWNWPTKSSNSKRNSKRVHLLWKSALALYLLHQRRHLPAIIIKKKVTTLKLPEKITNVFATNTFCIINVIIHFIGKYI